MLTSTHRTHRLLGGRKPGPVPLVTIHRWRALVRLATGGSVGWYEAWADGDWSSPDPVPLFDLFMRNRVPLANVARAGGVPKLLLRGWHALRRNDRKGSRRNIADHYDLGNDFYREWLDPSLTYSSGIYGSGDTLEQAQRRKLTAILDRTGTAPGDTILEIGCGWGSFAATASAAGRSVHGLTLSTEQKAEVDDRALPPSSDGLADPVCVRWVQRRDVRDGSAARSPGRPLERAGPARGGRRARASTAVPGMASNLSPRAHAARPRMREFVHRTQPFRADLRVHLRRRNIGVSQELLHDPQIRAVLQQVTCEGVTQHMRTDGARIQSCGRGECFQFTRKGLTCEMTAFTV